MSLTKVRGLALSSSDLSPDIKGVLFLFLNFRPFAPLAAFSTNPEHVKGSMSCHVLAYHN